MLNWLILQSSSIKNLKGIRETINIGRNNKIRLTIEEARIPPEEK